MEGDIILLNPGEEAPTNCTAVSLVSFYHVAFYLLFVINIAIMLSHGMSFPSLEKLQRSVHTKWVLALKFENEPNYNIWFKNVAWEFNDNY